MKNFLKSLPHHPKRVIIISLIIALTFGVFGYINIHKIPADQFTKAESDTMTNSNDDVYAIKNLSLGFLSGGKIKTVSVKVGDKVKKDDVLATLDAENATGVLSQARAAYNLAEANYQKIINGATGTTVGIAKAAVNTAEVNLKEITKQEQILVDNAYINLLNSNPEAVPGDNIEDYNKPTISGNYNLGKEGIIKLVFYYSTGGVSFNVSGIASGTNSCNTTTSQPIGNSGLYIKCSSDNIDTNDWNIEIPNKNAANYNLNNNAYQLALQTKDQAIAVAQATLDQTNASLNGVVANARPEDVAVASAQIENASGTLQIAEATYKNTIISAPGDGTITAVYITQGQIAVPNAPVIEFLGTVK